MVPSFWDFYFWSRIHWDEHKEENRILKIICSTWKTYPWILKHVVGFAFCFNSVHLATRQESKKLLPVILVPSSSYLKKQHPGLMMGMKMKNNVGIAWTFNFSFQRTKWLWTLIFENLKHPCPVYWTFTFSSVF